jgi:two-component system sensor histidine kinase UhpB
VAAPPSSLPGRLLQLQEHERRLIANELHDEIGQCLSAIRVQFALLQRRVDAPQAQALIASAAAMTERTLDSVRCLAMRLHPPQLDTLGLAAALRTHLEEQARLPERARILLDAAPLPEPLPADLALAAYRIVQEAVANALRHAGASRIDVRLGVRGDMLELSVTDDGRGFDATAHDLQAPTTLGLLGMVERAHHAGGTLRLEAAPGRGTRIAATLPLPRGALDDNTPGRPRR